MPGRRPHFLCFFKGIVVALCFAEISFGKRETVKACLERKGMGWREEWRREMKKGCGRKKKKERIMKTGRKGKAR